MHNAIPFVAALALLAAPAAAKEQPSGPSPLITAFQACQKIQDDAGRLACYDKAATALVGAASRGDVAVVDREQVRQVRRSLFGFSLPRLPFFSGSRDREVEEEPKEFVTSLTSFRSIGNGRYRFVVDQGKATWESTESAPLSDPRNGDKVTIRRGALGSYFAQIGKQRWVRARRVR
jgi:hypothetical protein